MSAHGSSARRVLSVTGAHPMGPLPHGTLPMTATRCATPFASLEERIGLRPILLG